MSSSPSTPIDRQDILITAALSVVSFALYMRTALPGVLSGDGGEFQALAYTLDHAHTTGYHVYLVLAKVWTLLPISSVAYEVNLFSAFMGAITVGLVYLLSRVVSGSRWSGLLSALALALSAIFWSQAVIAEVYTAGSALVAASLLCLMWWDATGSPRWLFPAGVFGGLGLGVHGSTMLFVPAVLLFLALSGRERLNAAWKPAIMGALVGILGLLAAFAIVDAKESTASIINAGYLPNISRWYLTQSALDSPIERFSFLFFARQWRSAMFVDPSSVIPRNAETLWEFFTADFGLPLRLLMLVGLVGLLVRRWKAGLFFLIALLVHLIYTLNYRIGDIYVFLVSLYVILVPLVGEGAAVLLRVLSRLPGKMPIFAQTAVALLALVLLIAPVAEQRMEILRSGEARWEWMGLDSNRGLENWYNNIKRNTAELPQNAVVLMGWNDLYGYIYAAHVDLNRPDLQFIEAYPYAARDGMADTLLEYLIQSLDSGRPVFMKEAYGEVQRGGLRFGRVTVGAENWFRVEKQ